MKQRPNWIVVLTATNLCILTMLILILICLFWAAASIVSFFDLLYNLEVEGADFADVASGGGGGGGEVD